MLHQFLSGSSGRRNGPPVSPNNCYGPDGMASTILHEIAETVTSPFFNAWKTRDGRENADLCASQYRMNLQHGIGVQFNLFGLNGTRFLAQAMFDPELNRCTFPA